ncbi:syntaxin-22-like isoform X2 [Chenopodium quinoa]|uniref:Syntaxin N-terminal domain-containing protein n=1 Tax=Chenopodium quinoa TaxID=63459 RepID=A0A803NA68_CHEQI|nr:syntaxin-22-like isoform X2 [Chenopodium quinoa]
MSSQDNQNDQGSSSEKLSHGVAAGIFQTNTVITTFYRLVNAIGTSEDTPDLRQKLHRTRYHVMTLVKDVSAKLKTLSDSDHAANVPKRKKIEDAKLARDFQASVKEFQKAQKRALERESSHILSGAPTSAVTDLTGEEAAQDVESQPFLEKKRSIWLDGKIEFIEETLEEREQEKIKEMQSRLDEILEFNKELAAQLHEPDVLIDGTHSKAEVSSAGSSESKPQLCRASNSGRSCSPLLSSSCLS